MYKITSGYLDKESFRQYNHLGIDFAMPKGTPLKSIGSGVVEKVVDYGSENIGKGVFIKFPNGETAVYGHLSEIKVKAGELISKGDLIGLSGNTGNVVGVNGGYHLHFGLKNIDGKYIDPSKYTELVQNMNVFWSGGDVCRAYELSDLANEQMNIYQSLFDSFQLKFISFNLIDNSMFVQNIENFFKFIS